MTTQERHLSIAVFAWLCLLPATAHADAVWQAVFLEMPIFLRTWWVVPIGLAVEYPVVHWMLRQSHGKAIVATVLVNLISFIVGALLQIPTMFMGGVAGIVAMFAIAIIGNTLIEGIALDFFRRKVFNRHTFLPLLGVNAVSVGLTIVVLLYYGTRS
jgi:type IV secretory pathway VirB2 component (pilin)